MGKHQRWFPIQGCDNHRVSERGEIKNIVTGNKLKGTALPDGEIEYRIHNNYDQFKIYYMTGREALMGVKRTWSRL